jgi:predicted Zn-dependent peptidase
MRAVGPQVEEHILSNGMKLLLVPRHLTPTVSGAWVAHVGSANERPGITGISHLFEHMMFKGTHVIGTRDYEKDVRLIDEQERVQGEMRAEMSTLRAEQRHGEIDDMTKPESKTPRMKQLEARFDSLVAAQRANMVKNEFDQVLSKNGATGTNAFTAEDMTVYFETLPANKLELWFWMESDRLKNRVFREFYSERDVVYEERRRSVESTPTGKYQESFESVFWDASPYSWPVLGWPSDVANITKAQADEYFGLYYAPQNLTAVLVGDFDPKQALALAEKYLATIPRGPRPAPEMITMETKQLAEKRFYGEAETNPGVTIRWHTVAFQHKDVPAIEVLSGILNGPTGRLQRNVVLGDGPATSASSNQDDRKYEGLFEIEAEAKDGRTPEDVEKAIYVEIEKLKTNPVSADELQKVKNRYLTSTYRGLVSNQAIMFRYAVTDGEGDWREADRLDAKIQAVTAADVQHVAQTYFTKENRAVAIWTRKTAFVDASAPSDPALASLPAEARGMVKQALDQISKETDPAKIQQSLARMDQFAGQAPPEMKPAFDLIRARAQARLDELSKAKK